jgi:glycosyltransferase involved in cell wall biosynthesis
MSDKLKVAFISPYFYPLRGGTENNCLNMALQTAKAGHEVTVFTSDRRRKTKLQRKNEDYHGIKIRRLTRLLFSQYYLSFLPSLPHNLLLNKYDVIHTHIPGVMWTDFAIFLKRLFSRKTLFINTPHDPFMSKGSYGFFQSALRRLYRPFLRFYYRRLYDYVIAVNPNQHQWIMAEYRVAPERIIYVPNGIDESMLKPVEVDPQLRKQYEINDQIVITMVARYHEYKGYQNVLQALTKIRNKRQLNFVFVGIGEDTGMLSRLQNYVLDHKLHDYVQLLASPNDQVRDQFLEMSEIFILASRVEAFGIAILEAMAKGNAIITTNTEGGKFLVGPENGLLYDFEDVDKLAEHISKLLTDANHRQQMIETNQKFAARHTWDQIFTPYAKLLEKRK